MSKWIIQDTPALHDPVTGALVGFVGRDGKEYLVAVAPANSNSTAGAASGLTGLNILTTAAAATPGTTLTNPIIQGVGNVNNFTQKAIQNKSAGASASADIICYPDNNANDLSGFVDIGITSSLFADAAYTVTGQNEAYLFGSAPAGSGKSGDLVIATDGTGTSNAIRFYTNGFNKAVGTFAARILSTGLFTFAYGRALVGASKVVINNGANTTYTVPAGAASIAFTFPTAAAWLDGMELCISPVNTVASVTWASTGATFVGAPAALAANVPVRFIYDHPSLQWLLT